ncbi:MAG: sulfatase, partial [Planctomycetota bacterium]
LALVLLGGRGAPLGRVVCGVFVALLAAGAFATGLPAGPLEHPPGLRPEALGAAAGVVLLMFALSRVGFGGPIGLLLGVAAAAGAVHLGRTAAGRIEPGQPVRAVLVDVVAEPDRIDVVAAPPDAPPAHDILAPAVDTQTDTGDKPSLILAPPSTVEFVVPPEANGARLVAAAGADLSTVRAYSEGLDVTYRVLVGDELRWETTFEHRPEKVGPGRFDASHMQWRHLEGEDGTRGLVVRAGERVRLETAFAPGIDAARFDAKKLKLGFGGVALVREGRIPRAIASPERPNILVVVMDTQRQDRLGCYGYDRPVSPNVDALSERGVRFADAYATSSWTWPSTASLMTGLPPDAHGVVGAQACTVSQRFTTLAEALQREGYTTAVFSGNPIVEPSRGFDQGVETFRVEPGSRFVKSDELVPPVLDWIDAHASLRFFLYLQLVDPHTPHAPHPEEAARLELPPQPADWPARGVEGLSRTDPLSEETHAYLDGLYDASVATGDRWVGEILARLEANGLTDRTVVVFTADHGEELFDHGGLGHGHALWSELVRTPLVMAGPGVPVGETRVGAVSNRFLAPTLARIGGTSLPGVPGALDLLENAPPGEAWFTTSKGKWGDARYQELQGLRRGPYTVHWRVTAARPDEAARADLRIFDVLAHPEQSDDLMSVREAEARELAVDIDGLRAVAAELRPAVVPGAGAGGRAKLSDIGYTAHDRGN